jgi:hypothetical protein
VPFPEAYYFLSLFDKGTAKLWKDQYVHRKENHTLCPGDNYAQFKTILEAAFGDVSSKDEALLKLKNVRKTRTVDEFNTHFQILIQKAGLNETENREMHIFDYSQGLKPDLAKSMIMQEVPESLSA